MPGIEANAITITGCGWVTPFAAGTIDEVLPEALRLHTSFPTDVEYWAVPDEIRDRLPNVSAEIKRDRGAWVTAAAFEHARLSAFLTPSAVPAERIGLVLGSALAGQLGMIAFAEQVREQSPRFVSPINFPKTVGNYISGALARAFDIRGPNSTWASGEASGLDAVVEACGVLASGMADVVFAGGVDTLAPGLARGFAQQERRLSEGACLFALERADHARSRNATVLAVVADVAQHDDQGPLVANAEGALLADASKPVRAAIWIEHWIGYCFGCLGSAAMAAAIGAARGHEVPVRDDADAASIMPLRPINTQSPGATTTEAVVVARAGDEHHTRLRLTIMPSA